MKQQSIKNIKRYAHQFFNVKTTFLKFLNMLIMMILLIMKNLLIIMILLNAYHTGSSFDFYQAIDTNLDLLS